MCYYLSCCLCCKPDNTKQDYGGSSINNETLIHNRKAKVLVAGDANVGKTSLMECLVQGKTQAKANPRNTITVQEHDKTISTSDGGSLRI